MSSTKAVIDFIDETLRQMVTFPGIWGSLRGLELQVLRMVEIRMVASGHPPERVGAATDKLMEFLSEKFPDTPPYSLWSRVESRGGTEEEFSKLLFEYLLRMGCFHPNETIEYDSESSEMTFPDRPTETGIAISRRRQLAMGIARDGSLVAEFEPFPFMLPEEAITNLDKEICWVRSANLEFAYRYAIIEHAESGRRYVVRHPNEKQWAVFLKWLADPDEETTVTHNGKP